MIILGIETSCDETSVSLVEDGRKILSTIVSSSSQLHTQTGGIIPEQAAREQIAYILPALEQALSPFSSSFLSWAQTHVDAIGVTYGPGLIGSLLVGVETARTLSLLWNKPLIPVNHLLGHLYANWIGEAQNIPTFPAIGFVVSGGHTDMVLMKDHTTISLIGSTRDDAAGEAFDKCARLLGLPYPGGPSISASAKEHSSTEPLTLFPRPMLDSDTFDFSFSGLKTAVLRFTQTHQSSLPQSFLAANVQEAIVDVLVEKSFRAVQTYHPKSFLLSGGVAANALLRERITNRLSTLTSVFIPPPSLCTDNGACIAAAAYYHPVTLPWMELTANPQLSILS